MEKLYKAEYDDGSILCFNYKPLICNNHDLFFFLISIENEKIKRLNDACSDAEVLFGTPMPRFTRNELLVPNIVEVSQEEIFGN